MFPTETIQELDGNIQKWYDNLVDQDFVVTTKAAAYKLFTLGFVRSEMRMKKGKSSQLWPDGIMIG